MRGTNYVLALTTTTDEVTGDQKPLFAFPVQICKGTSDDNVKFDIAAPSGAKREQVWRDAATGEIVTNDECLRGVRIGDDDFRAIPQESIDAINAEEKLTVITALERAPLAGLREKFGDRITGRYFVQSPTKGGSAGAYRLTYEALLADEQAIIVKRTKTTKQTLGFIYADGEQGCLILCEVVFASEVREADEQVRAPLTANVTQAMIDKAREAFAANIPEGTLAFENETDEAVARKRELIEQAVAGDAISAPTPVATTVVTDDLEAMLEASLAGAL